MGYAGHPSHVMHGGPTRVLAHRQSSFCPRIVIGVNKSAPTGDAPEGTTPNTTTPPNGQTPSVPGDNPLTGLLSQLMNLIPALLGVGTGSAG